MKKHRKHIALPKLGLPSTEVLNLIRKEKEHELKWKEGKSFCLMYYPGEEKAKLVQDAYQIYFSENALNPMSFPGLRKFENEVVAMLGNLLGGNEETVGSFTSGGTESILMAVKSAREYFRKIKPEIKVPEMIFPSTAHPAFNKACHYFDVKPIIIPVNENYKADVVAMQNAISPNTILLVGSAPSYPHGVLDPIAEIGQLAMQHQLLFHVDACVGGMILPFMKMNGEKIPAFDLSVPGVSSLSVDIHKFGYAAKGASIVLYKDEALRKFQFFVSTEWPGGIYGSAAIAGSRPGGAVAAAWAALMGIGENGYRELTDISIQTTRSLAKVIQQIPELKLMAPPEMCILAFDSDQINIYELADELNARGWHFERLQYPAGIHLTVNYIHHTVIDSFSNDLKESVAIAKKKKFKHQLEAFKIAAFKRLIKILPEGTIAKLQSQFSGKGPIHPSRTAAMYGMMGSLKGTGDLDQIVLEILNKLNKPD